MTGPLNIINLLCTYEETIGSLYSIYAEVFPKEKEFWESLSKQEYQHSSWIRSLEEYVKKGEFIFTDRFREAAVQTSIMYIKGQMEKAKRGELSETEALSIAYSIENSLLEKDVFTVFRGDSVLAVSIRDRLTLATEKHRHLVQEKWMKKSGS